MPNPTAGSRFNGDWQQVSGFGRSDVQIDLLELA